MRQIIVDLTQPNTQVEITEDTEILGLFVGHKKDLLETKLDVIHKKPQLVSNTAIKAVVYDQAKFNMIGNLIIETGAKFTDAYLRIDVLLMSEDATARAVPSLEITEDNVKGGHGATVGQVDAEQLFYLQSRGISRADAEKTLVNGFVQELLDKVQSKQDLKKLESILN